MMRIRNLKHACVIFASLAIRKEDFFYFIKSKKKKNWNIIMT